MEKRRRKRKKEKEKRRFYPKNKARTKPDRQDNAGQNRTTTTIEHHRRIAKNSPPSSESISLFLSFGFERNISEDGKLNLLDLSLLCVCQSSQISPSTSHHLNPCGISN
jgi:hypothetical protein